MPKDKRLHFKDIDALRFFAFAPIFLYCVFYLTNTDHEGLHYELTNFLSYLKQNSLDFFFFLSAFLITSQGLREYKYNTSFSLKNYFLRRILRILPLFIIGILFTFLVHPWILHTLKLNTITPPSGMSYFLLFPNYFSNFTNEQYVYLTVIWTIYMFIQFYIFWGLIIKYLSKHIINISIAFIVIGIAIRILHRFIDYDFSFDTLSYGIPIGVGGILAQLMRNESPWIEKIKNLPKKILIPIYLVGIFTLVFGYLIVTQFILSALIPMVTCVFFSIIIVEQTFSKNSLLKFRNNKVFIHLGKISYGMILFQAIINVLMVIAADSLDFDLSTLAVKIIFLLLSFVLTWIVADLSFNFFEKPFIRLRREFKKV